MKPRKLISSIYRQAHFQLRELYQQPHNVDHPQIAWKPNEGREFLSKEQLADHMRNNPTRLELDLLDCIRKATDRIYRIETQKIICGFIVDFFIPALHFVLEADGPMHRDQKAYDLKRDAIMARKGYHVMRVSEHDLTHQSVMTTQLIRERVHVLETRR